MLRHDLQRLTNVVSGRTVFILGGGTSITDSTIQMLNDSKCLVFGLNSSAKALKSPIGILWTDNSWGANNKDYLDSMACPKFFVTSTGRNYIPKDIRTQSNATVLLKSGETGFDSSVDCVRGNNSGAYAINLLVNCGVSCIGLLGYDMHTDKGRAHFHNDYTYTIRPEVYKNNFIPCIESMWGEMQSCGYRVKIFNCNKFSSLKCFEFKALEELI